MRGAGHMACSCVVPVPAEEQAVQKKAEQPAGNAEVDKLKKELELHGVRLEEALKRETAALNREREAKELHHRDLREKASATSERQLEELCKAHANLKAGFDREQEGWGRERDQLQAALAEAQNHAAHLQKVVASSPQPPAPLPLPAPGPRPNGEEIKARGFNLFEKVGLKAVPWYEKPLFEKVGRPDIPVKVWHGLVAVGGLILVIMIYSLAAGGGTLAPPGSFDAGKGADTAEAKEWVAVHNYHRCVHNMEPLDWDKGIADGAQAWADRGVFEHDPEVYKRGPPTGPAGENLAMGQQRRRDAANAWYAEVDDCATTSCEKPLIPGRMVGHYTAMVWKGSTKLGCGSGTISGRPYWVCRYAAQPPNMRGQYAQNVFAPDKSRKDKCKETHCDNNCD